MMEHWITFCLSDTGLLHGKFLALCRSLAMIHRNWNNPAEAEMYEQRALRYRGECLRSMRDCMPADGTAVIDYTVGKALLFACNEVSHASMIIYVGPKLAESRGTTYLIPVFKCSTRQETTTMRKATWQLARTWWKSREAIIHWA